MADNSNFEVGNFDLNFSLDKSQEDESQKEQNRYYLTIRTKLIYFGNLAQTLCYNYIDIVVLEVTLT